VSLPKRKKTPSKRDMRRANHDKVTPVQLVACQNCGEATLPHRACAACGHYKGRKAVPAKTSSS
jgi:large subunit ribosomal protein L32